ncbi:MAG: hypothetical protein OER74_19360 [Desulfobacteraceae bacterium]|nr:hypothetical protein [Desulfobacteraceae bacterium]
MEMVSTQWAAQRSFLSGYFVGLRRKKNYPSARFKSKKQQVKEDRSAVGITGQN